MADKEKYVIKIQGQLVEVSPEVYYAYFHMERQERWQEEKQQRPCSGRCACLVRFRGKRHKGHVPNLS